MKSQNKSSCPVCQSKSTFVFQKNKNRIYACLNCDLEFVHPVPSEEEIKDFYQKYWSRQKFRGQNALGYLSYLREKDSFFDYYRKILSQLNLGTKKIKVLDIGCSYGFFLKICQEKNWEIYGLDLSKKAVLEAKKDLGVKTIFEGNLEKMNFPQNSFDLITIFQTIEHVSELNPFLEEIKRVLKPGGKVIVATPDRGAFLPKLMRQSWFSYRHPDHLYFFSFKNLSKILKSNGFAKIRKINDPARVYDLVYLLGILKFYIPGSLAGLPEKFGKLLGPLGRVKVGIPLESLVITAQK